MPYVPPSMTGLSVAKGSSALLTGAKFSSFVNATSMAVCQYLPMASMVQSTNIVLGVGTGTSIGKIVGCTAPGMSQMMMTGAVMKMLSGKDIKKLFDAVSFGVCMTILTTGLVQGNVIGGGPGVGQGKILNMQPPILQTQIIANMGGPMLVGTKNMDIAYAIAFGCCMHIMSAATVINTCVGSFTPPPAGPVPMPTAPGMGRLV